MPTIPRDYYEVLGVSRDADQKTIKDAFRQLALQYHPDRNKAPDAEERFKEIAAAYAVLSDPKKRAEYDAGGMAGVAGFSPEDLFQGMNFEDIFGGLGFDFGGGGLFDRFFRRHHRPAGPPQGTNLEVDLEIPLERVFTGGEETVHLRHPTVCPACQGSGAKAGTTPRRCETCNGTGQQITSRRDRGITFQQITTCPTCYGRGHIIDTPCPECTGQGEVARDETLTVTIPVGVEEGMALRIPGRGMPSREAGGTPGDLFVVVRSTPDPRFERRGADLWREETIPVVDATLGTTLDVPTLDGSTTVTMPPGTQPDTVLRLRSKGLPEFGDSRRGDLYLRVRVHIPDRLSAEERTLYERLRTLSSEQSHRHR
jgi:molecular chaperone DnaJ